MSESFERHQHLDTGTRASATLLHAQDWIQSFARTTGLTLSTLEDNSFTHRPIELTPTELSDTRDAIAAAAFRASP